VFVFGDFIKDYWPFDHSIAQEVKMILMQHRIKRGAGVVHSI
jgi:hypothetical protein